jgi:hypothetical protein
MSSERQIEANRRNAQLSTGPRTPDGKSRVASNALKHGLSGKQMVLPGEDPSEFDAFRSDLITDLAPQGALEEILAEKIVADAWRLRRIPQFEAALYHREDRQAKVDDARREKSSHETDPLQLRELARVVKPGALEAHQAAEAKLRDLQAEPVVPLVSLTRILEKLLPALSNLERYETTLSRSLIRALHVLQRLQGIGENGATNAE